MKTVDAGALFSLLLCSCATFLSVPLLSSTQALAQVSQQTSISALGRLEPEHGLVGIGAPSTPEALSGSLLKSIHVKEGEQVEMGQLLAVTASEHVLLASKEHAVIEHQAAGLAASATRIAAEEACVLADVASREADRRIRLLEQKLASEEETETAQGKAEATSAACKTAHARARFSESGVKVAASRIDVARAELERTYIRAPFDGRVLDILMRPGEFIGPEAVLELGRTDKMYAIAEVYETDIRWIKAGQTASISSAALPEVLYGKVESINFKVEKQDVTGTDPAANKDARIIEVKILLDKSDLAASLTHLQVEIVIDI